MGTVAAGGQAERAGVTAGLFIVEAGGVPLDAYTSEARGRELVTAAAKRGAPIAFGGAPRAKGPRLRGTLMKKGAKRHNWKRRFFKLDLLTGSLIYYPSEGSAKILGAVRLAGAEVAVSATFGQFTVTVAAGSGRGPGGVIPGEEEEGEDDDDEEGGGGRVYQLKAGSALERDEWIASLRQAAGVAEELLQRPGKGALSGQRERAVSARGAEAAIAGRGEGWLLRKGRRTDTWNRRWFKVR